MIIHTMDQYSDEWWAVRKGIPTASRADKVITGTGNLSTQCRTYINELIADGLGLGSDPMEMTEWMLRGLELEPEALALFNFDTGLQATTVGFVTNDEATVGCSPDALIDIFTNRGGVESAKSGVEIKCPKPSTHIGYLLGGDLPAYYKPQVHWSMAVTGLREYYFMSYHPELDPLIVKVEWDEYTDKVFGAINDLVINLADSRQRLGL